MTATFRLQYGGTPSIISVDIYDSITASTILNPQKSVWYSVDRVPTAYPPYVKGVYVDRQFTSADGMLSLLSGNYIFTWQWRSNQEMHPTQYLGGTVVGFYPDTVNDHGAKILKHTEYVDPSRLMGIEFVVGQVTAKRQPQNRNLFVAAVDINQCGGR